MAVISKRDYAISYDMLEWIGCEVKNTHFRNCNEQYTCRFDNFIEKARNFNNVYGSHCFAEVRVRVK